MLHEGDCLPWLRSLPSDSVDACVTDPPYGLSFMGKSWDHGLPDPTVWAEVLRVLKPGGHVAAFGGTRTFHRLAVAIEDAGFDMRDTLMWLYGTGFPKSHDVSKGIDKLLGAERETVRVAPRPETSGTMAGASDTRPWIEASRERGFHEVAGPVPVTAAAAAWTGWGTALKPAWEPIILARKPLIGTVVANVLAHGTGAINVDGCRVGDGARVNGPTGARDGQIGARGMAAANAPSVVSGRWPANVLHDGSDDVEATFAAFGETKSTGGRIGKKAISGVNVAPAGRFEKGDPGYGDIGSVSRYFYSAKATAADRAGSKHPTVKPVALMRWLTRLVCPPGGVVLDPFAGSGTTLQAAHEEGFDWLAAEMTPEYQADIWRRMMPLMLS